MNQIIIIAILLIVFLAFLGYAIYLFLVSKFGVNAKRLESRLHFLANQNIVLRNTVSIFKHREFSDNLEFDAFFKKYSFFHHLDNLLIRSGSTRSVHQFLIFLAIIFIVFSTLAVILTRSMFQGISCGFIFAFTPVIILKIQNSRRQKQIESQLPDILDYIARSLNAGHAFNSAIQSASAESQDPIASEFKMTFEQLNLGVSVRDAMNALVQRIDTEDIRFFAIAVSINREVGGNLSELLSEVSRMIRARLSAKLSINALAAEGKASAMVLGTLPILTFLAIITFMPNYYEPLMKSSNAHLIIGSTVCWFIFGFLWMKKMTDIRM